jgi:hypothetical protein
MASFLATAAGLAFTLVVCLLVLRALLDPWLRVRRPSAVRTESSGEKQNAPASQTRRAVPFHTA